MLTALKKWWFDHISSTGHPAQAKVPEPASFRLFPESALRNPVWQRFAKMASEHWDRPAVIGDETSWSYRQLERKASHVCNAILHADLTGERPVALLLRHEKKMIAALLGTVKAGRPYVFLDPSLPENRLRFLLEDSGADLLLFDPKRETLAHAISKPGLRLLNLEEALHHDQSVQPTRALASDTHLCINYTSGTTGTPSGVVRTHRALLLNIRNMTNLAKISPDDRMILCISPASGAAAMDIFGALLNGASVAPFDVRNKGVPLLAGWMAEHRISFFHSVPTLFRSLVHVMEQGLKLPTIRFVLLGGEAVFRADLEAFQRHFKMGSVLQNVLGMTEGAGILCSYLANHQTPCTSERIPVGYTVPGKIVRVLDEDGTEVPVGEIGELTVESAFLSLGYHGQEERTRERYQVLEDAAQRRLKTRDLGRVRPEDGALEWLGRMDVQLKIGGLRVSPMEVEGVLRQDPAVREVVITLASHANAQERGRETQLVAWLIPQDGMVINAESLRHLVRNHLPPEAIPARFITLEELPLLPNGKVDRQRLNLDHPAALQSTVRVLKIGPRNALEKTVTEAWEKALDRESDSVYEHFFEMGGDSLAVVNLLAMLSSHFGFELPGHALLHYPTIAELAEMIPVWRSKRTQAGAFSESLTALEVPVIVALTQQGDAVPLYILPGGQGRETEMLVFAQVLARLQKPRPAYGLRISALSDSFATMKSLQEVATRLNESCRQKPTSGPWILVGECGAGLLAVEMARQLYEQSPEQAPSKVVLLDVRTNAHLSEIGFQANHGAIPEHLAHYYHLLFSWEPLPVDFPLQLIASSAFLSASKDATLGWSQYCRSAIKVLEVPGDHTSYIRQHANQVATALEQALEA